jgi:hypothetical protein
MNIFKAESELLRGLKGHGSVPTGLQIFIIISGLLTQIKYKQNTNRLNHKTPYYTSKKIHINKYSIL